MHAPAESFNLVFTVLLPPSIGLLQKALILTCNMYPDLYNIGYLTCSCLREPRRLLWRDKPFWQLPSSMHQLQQCCSLQTAAAVMATALSPRIL